MLLSGLVRHQLPSPLHVERDEGPHEFRLQQADGDEAVDAHHLDVEVADGGVEGARGGGERQAVPEGEDAESDAEQARDDEEGVEDGKGVLRQRRLLGEVQEAGEVANQLDQVLDEKQTQSHAREVEHVSSHREHCGTEKSKDVKRHFIRPKVDENIICISLF